MNKLKSIKSLVKNVGVKPAFTKNVNSGPEAFQQAIPQAGAKIIKRWVFDLTFGMIRMLGGGGPHGP